MFLEYLPEPHTQWFGLCAGVLDDQDFVALRAFVRSYQPHLEHGNQFRFIMHVVMLPQICTRDIIAEGTIASEIATNHVGADVLICPAERSSANSHQLRTCRASLDWADEDICPYAFDPPSGWA